MTSPDTTHTTPITCVHGIALDEICIDCVLLPNWIFTLFWIDEHLLHPLHCLPGGIGIGIGNWLRAHVCQPLKEMAGYVEHEA